MRNGEKVRLSPLKWLYPGYLEPNIHSIIPNNKYNIATEIVHEQEYCNNFLQNKIDANGYFSFFSARVESSLIILADQGDRMFSKLKAEESYSEEFKSYAAQLIRLLPKVNSRNFAIEFKHIDAFGKIFNSMKALKGKQDIDFNKELQFLNKVDLPIRSKFSLCLEGSENAYYTLKLSEMLGSISSNYFCVTEVYAKSFIAEYIARLDFIKGNLYGSEKSKKFSRIIENLEKITEDLDAILKKYSL